MIEHDSGITAQSGHAMDDAPSTPPRMMTFGEAMIRLTPPAFEVLERAQSLQIAVGGAELNAAVAAQCLGLETSWVSAVPDSQLGRRILREARAAGVDVRHVQVMPVGQSRTGLYFLEEATAPRGSAVTYDRAHSAFSRIEPGSFDWRRILTGASAVHISGITLALGDAVRAEAMDAMQTAGRMGVTVSFDLNYRSKLWSEAEARKAFLAVIPHVDVLFASRSGLRTFYGIDGTTDEAMRTAVERLGVAAVSITRKKAKGSRKLKLQGLAMGRSDVLAQSDVLNVEVVDRLGGGDAFAAGFLAGYLENPDHLSNAVQLANATSALKHTMPGDFLCATRADIDAVLGGGGEVLRR